MSLQIGFVIFSSWRKPVRGTPERIYDHSCTGLSTIKKVHLPRFKRLNSPTILADPFKKWQIFYLRIICFGYYTLVFKDACANQGWAIPGSKQQYNINTSDEELTYCQKYLWELSASPLNPICLFEMFKYQHT